MHSSHSGYKKLSKELLVERLIKLELQRAHIERELEQALHQRSEVASARQWYTDLFRHAPVASFVVDHELHVVEANEAATPFLRLEDAASLKHDEVVRHVTECLHRHLPLASDLTLVTDDRGEMHVQALSTLVLGGDAVMCMTTLSEVTAARRLERRARLQASAARLLMVPVDTPPPLAEVARLAVPVLGEVCFIDVRSPDTEGLRRVAVAACGANAPELEERFKHHPSGPRWEALRTEILSTRKARFERWPVSAPGTESVAELGATKLLLLPVVSTHGVLGLMALVGFGSRQANAARWAEDDYESAQALAHHVGLALDNAWSYAEARRVTRAREDMLATVAHDLRQPLAALQGGAASVHMNRTLRDLVDLSSLDDGRLRLESKPVDVGALVREVVNVCAVMVEAKQLALRVRVMEPLEAVGDADRLAQVLTNLIDNAVKFTASGGALDISAEANGDDVRVSVADSGPGIASDIIAHVFDRYWQATAVQHGGHGLGLALAKGIVTALGGSIGVESVLGRGSTFFFTVPRRAAS